jgi:hypothetical protein
MLGDCRSRAAVFPGAGLGVACVGWSKASGPSENLEKVEALVAAAEEEARRELWRMEIKRVAALLLLNLAMVEVENAVSRLMNKIVLKLSPRSEIAVAGAAMDRSVFTGAFWDIHADCPASFAVEFVIEKSARHPSSLNERPTRRGFHPSHRPMQPADPATRLDNHRISCRASDLI